MTYYMKMLVFISLLVSTNVTNTQTLFTKYEGKPVLRVGPAGSWDSKQVSHPRIIFDGKTYRMWYAGSNDTCRQIGYASSTDGINWTKYTGNPVIKIGERGALDDLVVSLGAVLFDGTVYHMYYTARSCANSGSICHATSLNGISWTKDEANNPVLKPGASGWWDDYGLSAGPVRRQSTGWKMWYNGFRSDTHWHAGFATSSDGVHWTKDTLNNPLFDQGAPGTWDEYEQWIADILYDSSGYETFYLGSSKHGSLGFAVSKDGIAWAKYRGNPVLTPDTTAGERAFLFHSCVLRSSKEYKIWYSDGMTAQICFANCTAFTPAIDTTAWLLSQIKGKPKTVLFAENKGKSEAPQVAKIPVPKEQRVTYENGIKIVGEKSFDVAIKEGIPYINGKEQEIDPGVGGANAGKSYELLKYLDKNEKLQYIQYADFGTDKKIAYLVYETAIFGMTNNMGGRGQSRVVSTADKSKIFLHESAAYIAPDGSIVATTPTTLLMITPKEVISHNYKEIFGVSLNLVSPTISKGADNNHAELRDESLKENGKVVKFVIEIQPFGIQGVEDAPLIGAR